jgi:hypothetical protein
MHRRAYRNHDAWRSSCISRGRCVCACARARIFVCSYAWVRTHACADQTRCSGGSRTSCCSSARSKLGLEKRHQQAAAAAVDSELVSAWRSPAALRTPCDRFGYGWCDDSISCATANFMLGTHWQYPRYIRCLRSLCSGSNRFTPTSPRSLQSLSRMAIRVSRRRSASQATRSMRRWCLARSVRGRGGRGSLRSCEVGPTWLRRLICNR